MVLGDNFPAILHASSFHLLVSALPLWLWAIMFLSFSFHLPVYNLPGVPNLADYFDFSDAVTTYLAKPFVWSLETCHLPFACLRQHFHCGSG